MLHFDFFISSRGRAEFLFVLTPSELHHFMSLTQPLHRGHFSPQICLIVSLISKYFHKLSQDEFVWQSMCAIHEEHQQHKQKLRLTGDECHNHSDAFEHSLHRKQALAAHLSWKDFFQVGMHLTCLLKSILNWFNCERFFFFFLNS